MTEHPFGKALPVPNHSKMNNGNDARFIKKFDNGYSVSIIRHNFSYGGKQGLYEIGLMYLGDLVCSEGITEDDDPVCGWLTYEDVIQKLEMVKNLEDRISVIN